MNRSQVAIRILVDRIDRRELRLPEIQRGYVWKPAQVAGLIDSLYRKYPSGSLLLWETAEKVPERDAAIAGPGAAPMVKPQYLLDGQQRLTSLHRVFTGHPQARVVFNVDTEKFQIESAAIRKDARWIPVHSLLTGAGDEDEVAEDPEDALVEKFPDLPRKVIRARLARIKAIGSYEYYLEILQDLPYEEVTQIFVRVNSRGRALRATDLALATLSARWAGVIEKFEKEAARCAAEGYRHLDFTFLTRCLAALVSETSSPSSFASIELPALEHAWLRLQHGLRHLLKLLKGRADIATSTLIPSVNALVPLVAYLGLRNDKPLKEDERDALLYWLFGAWILARYSGSSATVIAQDVVAIRTPKPIEALYKNLGLVGSRLAVTDQMLLGRGVASPFFLLSYLVARKAGACDWWFGVPVSTSDDGAYRVEYHHIHPRATLSKLYSKAQINDLANLAFISGKANRKISARSPQDYFPEVGDAELARHAVPLAGELRVPAAFPKFAVQRRSILADRMTALLEGFKPAFLDAAAPVMHDEHGGDTVSFTAYGTGPSDPDTVLIVRARTDGGEMWSTSLMLSALRVVLDDLRDGRGTGIVVGHEQVEMDGETDVVVIPMGPFAVAGSIEEWDAVLTREVGDLQPLDELPDVPEPVPWEGDRQSFPVIETD